MKYFKIISINFCLHIPREMWQCFLKYFSLISHAYFQNVLLQYYNKCENFHELFFIDFFFLEINDAIFSRNISANMIEEFFWNDCMFRCIFGNISWICFSKSALKFLLNFILNIESFGKKIPNDFNILFWFIKLIRQ